MQQLELDNVHFFFFYYMIVQYIHIISLNISTKEILMNSTQVAEM